MRLLEAILDANHRALAGDAGAGLRPAEYADALPLVALTCIDPRLNPLMPEVLGIPEAQFIWLRNAGNIITGPMSSTMRSLALACAVKGGREIAIIGHTDCLVCKTSTLSLLSSFQALGVDRSALPENLTEFFGLFSSERQNVLRACEHVRSSPLIGPKVSVHGLLVDIGTGQLEWIVNGYDQLGNTTSRFGAAMQQAAQSFDALKELAPFHLGEMKFPSTQIGEVAGKIEEGVARIGHAAERVGSLAEKVEGLAAKAGQWLAEVHVPPAVESGQPPAPPKLKMEKGKPGKIPTPPPIPGSRRPPRQS